MKIYKTEDIRNIAIVGGSGSGKTTLTESILFEAGVIKRRVQSTLKYGQRYCGC